MPVIERDPWRMQYFTALPCPDHVLIPTDDPDCYQLYPKQRWIYNKLAIAESQGLDNGPHGIEPPRYPVFSKPTYNLRGMGMDSYPVHSAAEFKRLQRAGCMWMELLDGEHLSSDTAVVDGHPQWWRHASGAALPKGTFDRWTVLAEARPRIEDYCGDWLRAHLRDYTGMVNLETIGGRIIEAHLRFSDQWPDLYGDGWLEAVVELYEHGRWRFEDRDRREGYSVVLFGPHGIAYRHPPATLIAELSRATGVSSIQITFHEDRPPEAHAMPPGGFRLAIVNCWDREAGESVRHRLAEWFGCTRV
jgi:hypothetical protein